MKHSRQLLWIVAAAALGPACSRPTPARTVPLPGGDAVWLAGGIAPGEPEIEPALARGGFATVFLPAAHLSREESGWKFTPFAPPSRPLSGPAVFLVVESAPPGEAELGTRERAAAWGSVLGGAVQAVLPDRARFGRVSGIHLDVPFDRSDPSLFAAAVTSVRSKLPAGMPLTVSLRSVSSEKDAPKWQALADAADGFVALVFGPGGGASPAATDGLGKPWWAGYRAAAAGFWSDARGQEQGALDENVLARLSDDPRVDFLQRMSLKEESDSSFVLTPRGPVTVGSWSFPAGSRIEFRQPSLADMIDRMGRDLAGRRFVRGRIVLLPGSSDSERIFTLAALVGVLSGGSLEPDVRLLIEPGRGSLQISAENASPNASVVSRTSNWAEVDVPGGGIRDVDVGGFDRYEVFGADERPALLGRATRVRLYETLVSPFEKIAPARILLRRVPPGCCAVRSHVLAASGKEVSR